MSNSKHQRVLCLLSALAILSSCSDNTFEGLASSDELQFEVSVNDTQTDTVGGITKESINMAPKLMKGTTTDNPIYFCPIVKDNFEGGMAQQRMEATTRGTQKVGTFADGESFGVSCYNSASGSYSFESLKATKQSSGNYTLASSKTIGDGDKTFYAVYPYVTDYSASTMSVSGSTIGYTVPGTYSAQPDLLYAVNSDASSSKKVSLGFYHALTAVCIQIDGKLAGTIQQVNIKNVYNNGTFTMATDGKGTWSVSTSSKASYTLSGTDLASTSLSSKALLNKAGNYFLLMPQTLPSDATLEIVCTNDVSGSTSSYKTYTVNIGESTWSPNTTVTYVLSTQKIVPIDLTVAYPTFSGGEACPFKTAYASGDKIGLYIVDASGKVVLANYPFTFNGSKWTSAATVINRSGYKYYAYYPYQSSLSGGPAVDGSVNAGVAASSFFGTAVTNWTIPADQSVLATLTAKDLQYGGNISASTTGAVSFSSMVHAMGCADLSIAATSIYPTYTYVVSTSGDGTTFSSQSGTGTKVNVTPTTTFTTTLASASAKPYALSTTHYAMLVKPSTQAKFTSEANPLKWATVATTTGTTNTLVSLKPTLYRKGNNEIYQYNYCGKIQNFNAPYKGTFKLEVWGAQGGSRIVSSTTQSIGGKGGYSFGSIQFNNNDISYIVVGGSGVNSSSTNINDAGTAGGYNGGGAGGKGARSWNGCGGGGATHIAKTSGLLSALSSSTSSILVVAGGGGGSSNGGNFTSGDRSDGGIGGGNTGGSAKSSNNTILAGGGKQANGSYGYKFGLGMSAINKSTWYSSGAEGNGGGGGGYYGGYSMTNFGEGLNCGGSGGSGFLNGNLTESGMQNGVRSGNGFAQITSYPY